jgi:predicted O-methyltransferase YrrM
MMTVYNAEISQYINDLFVSEDEALNWIRQDSQAKGLPTISVKPEEGRFLQFLVHACGARRAVEIGTLGGYSGTWIARGLPEDGILITLEKDAYHAQVAGDHFARSGVDGRVEIRVGDAHQLLRQLSSEGPFDFVFIDAEKVGYPDYFEWAVANLQKGGVIAAHNAFRGGSILNANTSDESDQGMQAFNRLVAQNPSLISTIFPAGDGTLIAVKR